MKKLLVLLVVLGLVNAANAAIIDLQIASLNGSAITPVSEITIKPSDTIDLQIIFTAPATEALFNLGVVIGGVPQGLATLGDLNTGLTYDTMFDAGLKLNTGNVLTIPANILAGYGPVGAVDPKVVVAGITIHCEAGDPAHSFTVTLANFNDNPTLVVNPSDGSDKSFAYGNGVTIHQVPEPMTLMLLGLGSLFLARRKK